MRDEQREAIEYLKESVLIYKNTIPKISQSIDTVLSLIKAQQEEISKYKTLYERALSDVVKTDKQIDLMAENIELQQYANIDTSNLDLVCEKLKCNKKCELVEKDCIKQYFERKVKDE